MDLSRYITLSYPEGLILGAAIAWLYFHRAKRRNPWRAAVVLVAIVLLGYPALVQTSRSFDLYILADRSRSISEESRLKQQEILELTARQLRPGDRLGIVTFNDKPYVEQAPSAEVNLQPFHIPYSEDASDLAVGLDLALNLVPHDHAARILLLSDGEFTGEDPVHTAYLARQQHVPVYYRNLARRELYNLAVRDVQLPEKILTGEPYRVTFRVSSTFATPGRYRLWRDGRIVGPETNDGWRAADFEIGDNFIQFVDSTRNPGIHAYKIEVEPIPADRETLVKDNSAERFINVVGEKPILVVNNTGQPDNVSRVLAAGGLPTHNVAINNYRLTIGQLAGYRAVIMNNVPVLGLTVEQLRDLRNFVEQEGGGLLVCGGNRGFAAGGYYKTELEAVLPVSLEDRQQSKKISTAFGIVMDRSGSMAVTTPSGKTKMSLAANAAAECINLMSAADSISVIVVDSIAHIIIPQQPVENPGAMISQVRTLESMGGGIFTYTGLVAGGSEIVKAAQLNKHILLFADAADAEEPGEYIRLLGEFEKAGITVSVIALGTESDPDAEFLKDIAKRGKGSIYFTQDAEQLMQFFTADTLTYTRSNYIDDAAPMSIRAGARSLAPQHQWQNFTAAGYNLLFKRPEAELDIMTNDDDQSPVLAHWQRGLGRVASLALDTQGNFARAQHFPDIVLAAARWTMGSEVFDNFQIKVAYEGGNARVTMEVAEEEREKIGQAQAVIFNPDGSSSTRPMRWESHDKLSTTIKLDQTGLHRGVIQVGGQTYKIGPMSLPVSPEFLQTRPPDFGHEKLAQLASITGGAEALDLKSLFQSERHVTAVQPFLIPLLIILLIFFILDIAESRFGFLAYLSRKLPKIHMPQLAKKRSTPIPAARQPVSGAQSPVSTSDSATSTEPAKETPTPATRSDAPKESDMDYLSRSKSQAERGRRRH